MLLLFVHTEMTSEKRLHIIGPPHTEMVYFISTEMVHCRDRKRAGSTLRDKPILLTEKKH